MALIKFFAASQTDWFFDLVHALPANMLFAMPQITVDAGIDMGLAIAAGLTVIPPVITTPFIAGLVRTGLAEASSVSLLTLTLVARAISRHRS